MYYLETSSPLSPLPPLEDPSALSLSPAIVNKIRGPLVPTDRRRTIGSITPPTIPNELRSSSPSTSRSARVSMNAVRPPRPRQLVKVLHGHTPKRMPRYIFKQIYNLLLLSILHIKHVS